MRFIDSGTSTRLLTGFAALAIPLAAGATAAPLNDVEIQLVDGAEHPLSGLDVFVHRADGTTLLTELNADSTLFAHDAGPLITIELPTLGASIDVQLTAAQTSHVTLQVAPRKGILGAAAVKPLIQAKSFGNQLLGVGAPPNDDCVNAIPIADGDTAFDTTGATTDGTVGSNNNEIWYTYTASCTGVATFSTCNQANFDTDLLLLTGDSTCAAQVPLAINDDNSGAGCDGNTSLMTAPVEAGTTYLLSVGGFGAGQTGSGTLSISCQTSAPNDFCSGAEPLTLNSSVTFDNSANTTSLSDPAYSCRFSAPAQGFGTTWFSFVADDSSVLLDTLQSTGSTDTLIGVYEGGCDGLVEIACGEDFDFDNSIFLTAIVVTGLTPGQEYLVQVGSFAEASQGSITLDITSGSALARSYFGSDVNTATLTITAPAVVGNTFLAEVAPGSGATRVSLSENRAEVALPFGELLIASPFVATSTSVNGNHQLAVPNDASLAGLKFYAQGLAVDPTLALTNGVELIVGSF